MDLMGSTRAAQHHLLRTVERRGKTHLSICGGANDTEADRNEDGVSVSVQFLRYLWGLLHSKMPHCSAIKVVHFQSFPRTLLIELISYLHSILLGLGRTTYTVMLVLLGFQTRGRRQA